MSHNDVAYTYEQSTFTANRDHLDLVTKIIRTKNYKSVTLHLLTTVWNLLNFQQPTLAALF